METILILLVIAASIILGLSVAGNLYAWLLVRINGAETQARTMRAAASTAESQAQEAATRADLARLDLDIVRAQDGMLPVARRSIVDGEVLAGALQLMMARMQTQMPVNPVPNTITYSPHYAYRNEVESNSGTVEQPVVPAIEPSNFWQLYSAGRLPDHGFLMGYNLSDGQPVLANWGNLYSALIGGQSGSGKSTLIRSILAQSALQGGRFVVLDKHFAAGEESLGASLMPLRSRMLCDVASTEEQMLDAVRYAGDIGRRRLMGDKERSPLIVVVDETTALLMRSNIASELMHLLGEIAQETRKVGVYALCIGQQFKATIMETDVRNSFVSFLSCRARPEVARVMSGSSEFGKQAGLLTVGQAVWMNSNGELIRLAVPNTTQHDIERVAGALSTGVQIDSEVIVPPEVEELFDGDDGNEDGTIAEPSGNDAALLDARAQRAIELFRDGYTHAQILSAVWQVNNGRGRAYVDAGHELQNIIREYVYQLEQNGRKGK